MDFAKTFEFALEPQRNPDMLKMEFRNIGFFVGNDDKPRDAVFLSLVMGPTSRIANEVILIGIVSVKPSPCLLFGHVLGEGYPRLL